MKILIIEDDAELNQNIKEALLAEGFSSDSVFDGSLAQKFLLNNVYDSVILDINLPSKNGYDICRDFRQFNTTTPIIILTAFDELEDKIQGFNCGADDYLTKPFFMKELILRIQVLVKRNNSSATIPNHSFGDIQINPALQKVTRQGKDIELTAREYHILYKLVAAKGDLVSKRDLIREIWGTSLDMNTNTVEVYINFLRKKIDKPFGKETIKTKIGFGYYLE